MTDTAFTTVCASLDLAAIETMTENLDFEIGMAYAGTLGSCELFSLLIKKGAGLTMNNALIYAAKNNHPEVVRLARKTGATSASDAMTQVVDPPNYAMIKVLLEAGAKMTPEASFIYASHAKTTLDIYDVIGFEGKNPNYVAVMKAFASIGKKDFCIALKMHYEFDLKKSKQPFTDGDIEIFLEHAAMSGNADTVKFFIIEGAKNFDRPMMLAARAKSVASVSLLVDVGAKAINESYALACEAGAKDVQAYLMTRGVTGCSFCHKSIPDHGIAMPTFIAPIAIGLPVVKGLPAVPQMPPTNVIIPTTGGFAPLRPQTEMQTGLPIAHSMPSMPPTGLPAVPPTGLPSIPSTANLPAALPSVPTAPATVTIDQTPVLPSFNNIPVMTADLPVPQV